MRTYSAKPADAHAARRWWIVDAKDQPLGRLASKVAGVLRGKTKATFTPHVDTGDFVIVINAAQIKVTGRKPEQKTYYRHTGRPGSIRAETFDHLIERRPEVPIEMAVRGMLPKNSLGRGLLKKLKVYPSTVHPHAAQKPEALKL
jgi:large subunit ribosomal protein L13